MKTSGETDCAYEFGKLYTDRRYLVFNGSGMQTFDTYNEALEYGRKQLKYKVPVNIVCKTTITEHICDL